MGNAHDQYLGSCLFLKIQIVFYYLKQVASVDVTSQGYVNAPLCVPPGFASFQLSLRLDGKCID